MDRQAHQDQKDHLDRQDLQDRQVISRYHNQKC